MPKITFLVNGQEKPVDVASEETILQAAQANGIPMESACGGNGFCMTCKCHVRKGAENLSPPNEREEAMGMSGDERLGCQALIKGDATVELEGA
ncbi:MAG: 2Fe-2S iron-sulfur cluster-binding protein [Candidatus Peribacter sp.]|nr:2Fe-2S iron-sulfur cluster-binding protein [Candidatus Peribacter sp.]